MGATPNQGQFFDGSPMINPVVIYGPNGQPITGSSADGIAGTLVPLEGTGIWNGTTMDRLYGRNNAAYIARNAIAVYSLASALQNANGNSGDLVVSPYTEIGLDITTTAQAGTNPTVQLFWERKGADGVYYVLWQSAVLTVAANTLSTSIGAGMAYNQSLGITGRFRWVIGGSASPSYTFSANVYGK
jgi:hypothetical protein